jgi:hypothetical protein
MTTCDDVKGELYYFFTAAANQLLNSVGLKKIKEAAIPLKKMEHLFINSENSLVKEVVGTIINDKDIIFGVVDLLSPYQLEQSITLIEGYENSLKLLPSASEETKEEFYLTLTYNILKDLKGYTDELNEMVRRKRKPIELPGDSMKIKVDDESTFFLY